MPNCCSVPGCKSNYYPDVQPISKNLYRVYESHYEILRKTTNEIWRCSKFVVRWNDEFAH